MKFPRRRRLARRVRRALPCDWYDLPTSEIAAKCRELPRGFRLLWAESVIDTLNDEHFPRDLVYRAPRHGTQAEARLRRVALHVMREVCGLTVAEAAARVGLSVTSAGNALQTHRDRHRYVIDPLRDAGSEVATCDEWMWAIARACWDAYHDPDAAGHDVGRSEPGSVLCGATTQGAPRTNGEQALAPGLSVT